MKIPLEVGGHDEDLLHGGEGSKAKEIMGPSLRKAAMHGQHCGNAESAAQTRACSGFEEVAVDMDQVERQPGMLPVDRDGRGHAESREGVSLPDGAGLHPSLSDPVPEGVAGPAEHMLRKVVAAQRSRELCAVDLLSAQGWREPLN